MQIFVETLSGAPLMLSVAADASIASVMQAVEDVEYIPNFRLVCAGKQLSGGLLADYAVGECDTLKMLLSVNGVCVPSGARNVCVVFVVNAEKCVSAPDKLRVTDCRWLVV